MSTKIKVAKTIAAAAALAFATAPVTSALVQAKEKTVYCYGVNACKGQSDCSTASAGCKGENTCKGKGFLSMTPAQCKKAGGTMKEPKLGIDIN